VPPAATGVTTPDWVVELVDELRAHGAAAQANYPVGRWVVDLCAGKDGDAVAVEAGVHPDGPEAHVARHRALRRTGWRVVDGYPTRWDNDAARAAFDITESLRR
jgi:very-short-patch-repair endonuclease